MKPADQAFVELIRAKYDNEYKAMTDSQILEEKMESLNVQWAFFCSGWNAAVVAAKKFYGRDVVL